MNLFRRGWGSEFKKMGKRKVTREGEKRERQEDRNWLVVVRKREYEGRE